MLYHPQLRLFLKKHASVTLSQLPFNSNGSSSFVFSNVLTLLVTFCSTILLLTFFVYELVGWYMIA